MQSEIKALENIHVKWDKGKPAKLMAKQGEKLLILHDGGTALVVKNEKGEAFSIMTKQTDYENLKHGNY